MNLVFDSAITKLKTSSSTSELKEVADDKEEVDESCSACMENVPINQYPWAIRIRSFVVKYTPLEAFKVKVK